MGYNYQTSLPAYHDAINKLSDKQRAVYVCLCEHGPMTNEEISKRLVWPINCVTPRTGELIELLLVAPDGLKKGPSGRFATVLKALIGAKRPEYQEVMF